MRSIEDVCQLGKFSPDPPTKRFLKFLLSSWQFILGWIFYFDWSGGLIYYNQHNPDILEMGQLPFNPASRGAKLSSPSLWYLSSSVLSVSWWGLPCPESHLQHCRARPAGRQQASYPGGETGQIWGKLADLLLTCIAPSLVWDTFRRRHLPLLSRRDCLEPAWESILSQLNEVSRMEDNLGSTSSLSCSFKLIL